MGSIVTLCLPARPFFKARYAMDDHDSLSHSMRKTSLEASVHNQRHIIVIYCGSIQHRGVI